MPSKFNQECITYYQNDLWRKSNNSVWSDNSDKYGQNFEASIYFKNFESQNGTDGNEKNIQLKWFL